MASGDFGEIDAGNTLAILRRESIIMDDKFELGVKHDGDFASSTDGSALLLRKGSKSNEEATGTNKTYEKEKKLGHRRVHTDGGVSYKKIHTSKIMNSIQLGIQRSVGVLAANPERDVLMGDFMTVESTSFTTDDFVFKSARNRQFIFKTYAPVAFRHFRDLFGIKTDNFVSSFCTAPLVELPNPGASGSVFYLTQNDDFITKTVQHTEAEFLQKLLPGYYLNLNQNPCTLLPKYFGLYCYKCDSKNVRLVVMNNVLPSSITIHQKYDLKGSTFNRKASKTENQKSSPTFKDLDFIDHHPEGIFVDTEVYKTLVKTIQSDCRVLESFQIIDYSLLLGVHNLDQANKTETEKTEEQVTKEEINYNPCGDGIVDDRDCGNESETKKINSEASFLNRTKGAYHGTSTLTGLPARQANGENLLLFIGIIDILQSYRLKKRLEHVWKSILHDGSSVSVHNPEFYARRFQEFVSNTVFKTMPPSPKSKRRKFKSVNETGA